MNQEQMFDVWADRIQRRETFWKRVAIFEAVVITMTNEAGIVIATIGGAVILIGWLLNKYVTKPKQTAVVPKTLIK